MHANTQWRTHSLYPCCLGLPKSSQRYLPPLPQTAVCTYVCCVVVGGVVCTVKGYNLVVNERWKNRWPAELGARCSPTASKTSAVFLRSAKYRGPTTEPCGTPSLADLNKTLRGQKTQTPQKTFLCRIWVNQRITGFVIWEVQLLWTVCKHPKSCETRLLWQDILSHKVN